MSTTVSALVQIHNLKWFSQLSSLTVVMFVSWSGIGEHEALV